MIYSGSWQGFLIVGGGVLTALMLVELVKRLFTAEQLRDGHDVTGNLLAIVGTLYAVLLGLIVVDAMSRFERAMDNVQEESNCLADIYMLADRLPEPQRGRIHDTCRRYARVVVEQEWDLMALAKPSPDARRVAYTLTRSLDDFEPVSESHKSVYPMILEQVRELWDARRERINTAEYGIPVVEWVSLLLGAAVIIVFAGLFNAESERLRWFVTSMTALVIGLNLYLVALFGYPFAGELSVSDRPFAVDLAIFENRFEELPERNAGRRPSPPP